VFLRDSMMTTSAIDPELIIRRKFSGNLIFHLSMVIFHWSLSKSSLAATPNDKRKMANGKSSVILP
jgi:hypothetical protein